ncbi:hypothetical protein SPRG_14502 [Saprolegnia parasitica CBS 223.65]|uniref:Uncharacterized protein n=1 Tax=Saprolegnia parasitica (strain CBS 223.65) TaxID=695850 RepID=A0A067BTV3_SAPPC|nr:hypothetical protein SPRG_14502 [Saprolegnia parasitica CBS 223.65]KDO20255.1 hypothetical protein SPRG_14502 [Saprolegnia parasitica CBS 223.65]|eukprot:XP_012209067.1 hypothetical protein SPRG_14502 [Saprolegnia parasitica CBS 223.65]
MVHYANYGRWTAPELHFLQHLVSCFLRGILEDDIGETTLRQYVSTQLKCDPMRVTKRLKKGRTLVDRLLLTNFNRKTYKHVSDYNNDDINRLNDLKQARLVFEASLRTKRARAPIERGYLSMHDLVDARPKAMQSDIDDDDHDTFSSCGLFLF